MKTKYNAILGGLLATTSALAATTPTSVQTVAPSAWDKVVATYIIQFNGGPLTNPFPDYLVDEYGQTTDTQINSIHSVGVGYKIAPAITVGATGNFVLQGDEQGRPDFTSLDPYLKATHAKLITAENLNVFADLRFYLPVTVPSQKADLFTGIRSTQILNYDIPDTKFSVGTVTFVRWNVYGNLAPVPTPAVPESAPGEGDGQKAVAGAFDMEGYLGPNINYQITPAVGVNLLYEMDGRHRLSNDLDVWESGGTDLSPSVSWDITPRFNFNPYLTVNTGGKVALESTTVGFYFTSKLLPLSL